MTSLLAVLVLASHAYAAFGIPAADATGKKLRWRQGSIQIAVSTSLTRQNPNIKYDTDVAGALRRSIQTWRKIVDLELVEATSEKQGISPAGPRGDGVSLITIAQTAENVLFFSNGLEDSAAATRVFFDKRGFVTEADIALNPFQQFSTDGTVGTFDLESTLTHEIGHLLGLEHSSVLGATMHARYGKNGAYGLSNFSARTLSQGDITEAQRLYGSMNESVACCAGIGGKLTTADGKTREWQVWAEDPVTGQVRADAATANDGTFRFDGLSRGSYSLYAQDRSGVFAALHGDVGEVVAGIEEPAVVNKKLLAGKGEFRLDFLGFNGQLSDIAIALNRGKSYTIYLGGKNLDPARLTVGFNSKFLSIVPDTIRSLDFGSDVSVISFELRVDRKTPAGDYSVFVASEDGVKRYIVGGLTIEEFANPWSKFNVDSN